MDFLHRPAALAGRVVLGLFFLVNGVQKLFAYGGMQGFMEAYGVPGALLPLVIALEIGGGLLLVLGFWSRLASLALAGFSIVAALIFHSEFGDQMQTVLLLKNFAIAAGFVMVFAHGPGALAMNRK